jgi:hypothetical protein
MAFLCAGTSVIRKRNRLNFGKFMNYCFNNYRSVSNRRLLDNNIDTIEKNTKTLIDASKEVGL